MKPTRSGNLCSTCHDLSAEMVWCVGSRRSELKTLIDNYKFSAMRSASRPLVELLDLTLPALPPEVVVTVVPAASAHTRERGFDHMARIGREFAALRQLPYRPLLRRTLSDTQHFKTRRERLEAAQQSYVIMGGEIPEVVLLIDDILTTGATLGVNLGLLRDAGVKSLYGAVIARQPLDDSADLW